MKCFMVDFPKGCFLLDAKDEQAAHRAAASQEGSNNGPYLVREADISDIAWVRAMNGRMTETAEKIYKRHYKNGSLV